MSGVLNIVSMSAGIYMGSCLREAGGIRTKTDVMKYALEMTATMVEGAMKYNLEEAKKVFDFYCENVKLMDSEVVSLSDIIDPVVEKIKELSTEKARDGCVAAN